MKYVVCSALVVLFLGGLVWASNARGEVMVGAVGSFNTPICKTEKDMVEVAKADEADGVAMAIGVLQGKADCARGQFYAKVVRVVFSAPTARGATIRVLEVEVDGQKFFVLTDSPLTGVES